MGNISVHRSSYTSMLIDNDKDIFFENSLIENKIWKFTVYNRVKTCHDMLNWKSAVFMDRECIFNESITKRQVWPICFPFL